MGWDAAVVQFSNVTDPHWKLLYFKCLPYPEALKKQIEAAYENASLSDKASARLCSMVYRCYSGRTSRF